MNFKNAAIYVRVSTKKQVEVGYSIKAQKENLINFAKIHDFKIYDIYADEGISGKTIIDRPDIRRLIKDIENKKIDVVLFQQFDRLTRSITDTQEFINLFKKYNIDVWSINDGGIVDISTSNGKFMTLLKGLFGEHERDLIAERIKIAFKRKAHEGYTLCCGCPPYGYIRKKNNKIIEIKKDEAKIVKRIFKMYIENESLTNIAKTLNIEGIPTKKEGKIINNKKCLGIWTSKTIKLILTNPVYIGKIRYGINRSDYYIGDGKQKSIISIKNWNEVQNKITKIKGKKRTNKPKEDAYFCGSLICGMCNSKLTTSRTKIKTKEYISYRCPSKNLNKCNAKNISHKKVEEAFLNYLKDNINDLSKNKINISNKTSKNEINYLSKIINNQKNKQKELMNLFIAGKLKLDEYTYMNKELQENINANELKLNNLKDKKDFKLSDNELNIKNNWENLTNIEKYNFLINFIEYITIINDIKGKVKILNVKFYTY